MPYKNSWSKAALLAAPLIARTNAYVMPDGHTGKLPTLGWNSWNTFACDIDESKFLSAAKKLVDTGLKDAGYNYVNIDDCWSMRDGRVDGHIAVNKTRFPDGIDGLAGKIHDMGLKIGIYSSAGDVTCQKYPASLGHEETDAADFAKWGIDYLKYDNCGVPSNWVDEYDYCAPDDAAPGANGTCTKTDTPRLAPDGYDWSKSKSAQRFNAMRDALAKQDHPILFGACIWGTADVFSWGNDTAVSWRMSGDISASWGSVLDILNLNSFKLNTVDFWGHNDADMLEVGNNLSHAEARSHFALWAAMKSPLFIGADLEQLDQEGVDILKNERLIAFNQDEVFGGPATPYKWGINPDWTFNSTHPAEYWSGKSKDGTLVLMLNTLDKTVTKKAKWLEVPGLDCNKKYKVTDVWTGKDLGCLKNGYKVDVEAHDTAAILVSDETC